MPSTWRAVVRRAGARRCQTAGLIHWKEARLQRVVPSVDGDGAPPPSAGPPRLTVADLQTRARKPGASNGEELFSCQATELLGAAPERLPFRDLGQYVQDVSSGNVGVLAVLRAFSSGCSTTFGESAPGS